MREQHGTQKNTSPLLLAIVAACFGISVWVMAPGWLTVDSLNHYVDAKAGVYHDMFPVLLSWIWNKLMVFGDSPLPMLVLNLAPYWAGFYFLSEAARSRIGNWAALVPLLGFWPGIFEQVGFVWKDIIFATMMLFAWSVVIAAYFQERRPRRWERIAIPIALTIAVGVKPNGITALPFVFGAWFYVEGRRALVRTSLVSIAASLAVTAVAYGITMPSKIVRQQNFMGQYTQIYDLLGMSAGTGKVLLPSYITDQRSSDIADIRKEYWAGGVPSYFFNKNAQGDLTTSDRAKIDELFAKWSDAIKEYPSEYLHHRWENLAVQLRLGAYTPAWVGEPGIWENPLIPPFKENPISRALGDSIKGMPWAYLPWVYGLLALLSLAVSLTLTRDRLLPLLLGASSFAFFAPHFFVLPAADYRYLYYCYLAAFAAAIMAVAGLTTKPLGAAREIPAEYA
ncbi:hypothetical protein I4N56_005660 [Pseudomonas mohnii]|uniref:hypothetical protein n=1 Tax=Pseudomonas mohnii TaxID=395600 RepID=UPI0018DE0C38|nr:hypothetical protein [Pseudomonas mohnii]MBH8610480.1 hypothetical protein [Pseudomonas mohnii]